MSRAYSALFLHFDEQLTSGLRMRPQYSSEDIVFWLHLYSLFVDTLYIPANELIDATTTTTEALLVAGIQNANSILRMEDGPVRILWDENRFPFRDFGEMFERTAADPYWCTDRDPAATALAAKLCAAAPLRIVRVPMTSKLNPRESVMQLKEDIFTLKGNAMLERSAQRLLQEALTQIERRTIAEAESRTGLDPIFSRNFFYAAFGYGKTPEMQRIANGLSDVVGGLGDGLREYFLSGVDYVSHSLKAVAASRSLSKGVNADEPDSNLVLVDALMPEAYSRHVLRHMSKHIPVNLDAGFRSETGSLKEHAFAHVIDRNAIISATGEQLKTLRASDEYRIFQANLRRLRDRVTEIRGQAHVDCEKERLGAEGALNAYLTRITLTLQPFRGRAGRSLAFLGRMPYTLGGAALTALLGILTPPNPEMASPLQVVVELFARTLKPRAADERSERIDDVTSSGLPATIRVGEDMRLLL